MLAISVDAPTAVTPGLRRAKTPTWWKRRSVLSRALNTHGIQTSERPTTDASGGMIPTTVYGSPSMRTVAPTTPSAPPNAWRPTRALVVGTYPVGGLFSLHELVHENGHAVHISAIRNRPAFTDWPDTLVTEAFADVPSWSVFEPQWQRKYLGKEVEPETALRAQFGNVILDVTWSLFELRLLRDPSSDPNLVWTEITSHFLHIEPHLSLIHI